MAGRGWERRGGQPGTIVVLNGTPRSGKTSIVHAVQQSFDGPWMNLGVDLFARQVTPVRYQPGMGLRPGGERPDIEPLLPALNAAFYDSVVAHSRQGLHVIVDVGHHDDYSLPMGLLRDAARRLAERRAFLIGVRCPVPIVVRRRAVATTGSYSTSIEAAQRWEDAVHRPGIYDLEVNTSVLTPEQSASAIRERLAGPPPAALRRLACAPEGV